MPQPDPVPPEGETLAHFAVVLAAHRGQLAALDGKVRHLSETVQALTEGGPKGPPMIAWHDLDPDEAAAVRADLAKWVDEVLFALYPSARRVGAGMLAPAPRRGNRTISMLAGIPQDLRPRRPVQARQASPPRRPPLADSLVYLDRWLPGTLRRVRAITDKCTGIEGHIPSPR